MEHGEVRDALELSIILNAPFAVGFLERILNIEKSQIAPFGASFLSMITRKLSGTISTWLAWLTFGIGSTNLQLGGVARYYRVIDSTTYILSDKLHAITGIYLLI